MPDNAYMAAYMLRRYYERRQRSIEQLGGCCVMCGSQDSLEFDHIDAATKTFTIGTILNGVSEELLQKELTKCQLLCEDCHKEKHKSEPVCGTVHGYKCGCRCRECKTAIKLTMRKYRKNKNNVCFVCGVSIDPRSKHCRSCSKINIPL